MKAEDRKVSGSSRKELIPMVLSRCLISMPTALEAAPKTVPSSTDASSSTSNPPIPPG